MVEYGFCFCTIQIFDTSQTDPDVRFTGASEQYVRKGLGGTGMKRIRAYASVMVIVMVFLPIALWGAGGQEVVPEGKPVVLAMVTDAAGLGDQCFNDATWAGLVRAEEIYGYQKKVLEAREQAQYVPYLSSLAEQRVDLIIGVGFMMKDAVAEVAALYPDSKFGIVDGTVDAPNVACLHFHEHQGAFIVGVIGASMSKSGIIGFVGGMETPITKKFEAGYRAGAKTANPNIKVLVTFTGTFTDMAKGEETATAQYNQGADVIYQVANVTGMGVFNAAKKLDKYAIGADMDQNHIAPNHIITSSLKRIDNAVLDLAEMIHNNDFQGGHYIYGVAEGGIDYAPTTNKLCPPEVVDLAEKIKKMIADGTIQVPSTMEEFAKFVPPRI
jgi:basic membrane protein A